MILFSAEAILASSTSKFGIEITRIDDEVLNSSTDSTSSTSLIHCIASVGNCEQVVEEDGEGQVEVESEEGEVRENRTSWMTWREDDGHLNNLSQEDHDSTSERQETRLNSALLCSLVQIARVVIVRVILVGVLGVTVDVHIGHDEVRVNVV